MSVFRLLIVLIEHFGLLLVGCFCMMQFGAFKSIIIDRASSRKKCLIAITFGIFGILGTYVGAPVMDAYPNLRGMASITAGIIGGPIVGLGAGLIAGGHRYLLGGFTALPCGLSTLVEGVLAGVVSSYLKRNKLNCWLGFGFGVAGESLHMLIVLLIAKPFSDAWMVVRMVGLPMIMANSMGIAILLVIFNVILREEEKAGAVQAQKSLQIATMTLGYLRNGLNIKSAGETARIIYWMTDVMTVGITDQHKILASVGQGADYHRVGKTNLSSVVKSVIRDGKYRIIRSKAELECPEPDCPLYSGIIVPLKKKGDVVGTLNLYRGKANRISRVDIELAMGLAHLFSTQIELEEIQQQAQLLNRAEIKALQAQVNPHFFFNTLNTIVSFCRTDMEKAIELIIQLGKFFRSTLNPGNREIINLEEELENVRAYLMIEEARFGNRIEIIYRLNHPKGTCYVPQFILQPIVENAIKHGLSKKEDGGKIYIETRNQNGELHIAVSDNGVGISSAKLGSLLDCGVGSTEGCGIALYNINQRLIFLFGLQYKIKITSIEGSGTRVCLPIPQEILCGYPQKTVHLVS